MSHDKLKAATRRRMAVTGEPYTVARRAIIMQHEEARHYEHPSEAAASGAATEVVAEQLVSYGQMVRRQLAHPGSGIDEIQRRFEALHWFRGLGHSVDERPTGMDADTGRPWWQCRRCGSGLQLDGASGWASSSGTGRCLQEFASW